MSRPARDGFIPYASFHAVTHKLKARIAELETKLRARDGATIPVVHPSAPVVVVVPYAGTSAPAGYLLCFGQAISRTTFAALFAVCSTTYGAGDGSTTFNVPDLRGYVAAGKDDMGGSAAGRLSGGTTLGAGLGAQTHNHSGSTMDGPNNDNLAANGADFFAANVSHTHGLHIASDTNVQPTFILNYVIKT